MTKLSLFLYSADVLDAVSGVFKGLGIISIIATILIAFCILASWCDEDTKNDEGAIWLRNHTTKCIVLGISCIIGCFTVRALIPEKKTMYMIAGVEMADEFSKTATAAAISNEMKMLMQDITGIIHSYALDAKHVKYVKIDNDNTKPTETTESK